MSAKQAINDKLQGSVATNLGCGGVVNNQIKKGLLLSLWVKFFVNRRIFGKFSSKNVFVTCPLRLANTLLKDEESARDNHVLACNFAKY